MQSPIAKYYYTRMSSPEERFYLPSYGVKIGSHYDGVLLQGVATIGPRCSLLS